MTELQRCIQSYYTVATVSVRFLKKKSVYEGQGQDREYQVVSWDFGPNCITNSDPGLTLGRETLKMDLCSQTM